MSDMAELNLKMYDFARRWADGLTLAVSGVSLADCIAYDVLSVIGRQLLEAQEPKPSEKPSEAQASDKKRTTP
jgi:hypothetical protein